MPEGWWDWATRMVGGGDEPPPPAVGLVAPGNIDLTRRPRVKNPDGTTSTVRSISINEDGREILIPTVVGNRVVSDDEAIREYHRTGKHLGIFDSPTHATAYAQALHQDQAKQLSEPTLTLADLKPVDQNQSRMGPSPWWSPTEIWPDVPPEEQQAFARRQAEGQRPVMRPPTTSERIYSTLGDIAGAISAQPAVQIPARLLSDLMEAGSPQPHVAATTRIGEVIPERGAAVLTGELVGEAAKKLGVKTAGKGITAAAKAAPAAPLRFGVKAPSRLNTIYNEITKGGYTVDLKTGEVPTEGTMTGLYPNYDTTNVKIVPLSSFTTKDVQAFVKQHEKELAKGERYLGGWVSEASDTPASKALRDKGDIAGAEALRKATGKPSANYPVGTKLVYLDTPKRFVVTTEEKGVVRPDLETQIRRATKTAEGPPKVALDPNQAAREAAAQEEVFTLGDISGLPRHISPTGSPLTPVRNWRSFIEGPVYGQHYTEMHDLGEKWLKTKGGKEWWSLYGSAVEDVYGTDAMKQMAGFLAVTSPRTSVEENIRHASVYMQRHILGEPIVQPGRLYEGGQFYGRSGPIQMPFETVRAKNLELAAQGLPIGGPKTGGMQRAALRRPTDPAIDPTGPTVIDTHHTKLGEDPTQGIYLGRDFGTVSEQQYPIMEGVMQRHALARGEDPTNYSAKAWTGIILEIQNKGHLYGTPYNLTGSNPAPLAEQFIDVVKQVATHHGMSLPEFIRRVRAGDRNLLTALISTGLGWQLYEGWRQSQATGEGKTAPPPRRGPASTGR